MFGNTNTGLGSKLSFGPNSTMGGNTGTTGLGMGTTGQPNNPQGGNTTGNTGLSGFGQTGSFGIGTTNTTGNTGVGLSNTSNTTGFNTNPTGTSGFGGISGNTGIGTGSTGTPSFGVNTGLGMGNTGNTGTTGFGGLTGNTGTGNVTTGTSGFGGLGTTNPLGGGLKLGTTTTTTTGFSQPKSLTGFGGTTSGFPLTTSNLIKPSGSSGMMQGSLTDQNLIARNPKVFTLPPTNLMRYDKISSLSSNTEELKVIIGKIEENFKSNSILLDICNTDLKLMNDNFNEVINQGSILAKYARLINNKNVRIKLVVEKIKYEMRQQSDMLEKQKRNFNLLYEHNLPTITVPNEYFFELIQEVEDKIYFQMQQLSDLNALTTLYYKKEHGSFDTNPDIIEELIRDLNETLQYMIAESANLNDIANNLRRMYEEYMMTEFNMRENEIALKLKSI